ncbi:MFS transporter [candidate division FCPU426 bacterium]|nr:MFS transporter [candidate division FCPU426 bacterium]
MCLNRKRLLNIILPLFIGSVIAYLDRINIAYAALTMNADLGFTAAVFGMGAGIFFAGYVLFEIPGALIAERWSPRVWLARIMVTWGIVSLLMAFIHNQWQFYLVRFLLGAAEASFYPVAYASVIPRWYTPAERPRAIALMLASLQISAMIGSPLAGWMIGLRVFGLQGWQLLFILEAIPACLFGIILLFWIKDRPAQAGWLSAEEKAYLTDSFARETEAKNKIRRYTVLEALGTAEVIKLCCIYFLWITGFWGYNYWLPTVLKEASSWSAITIGWMIVIPMTLALVGMLFVGYSSSRTNEKRWHGAIPMFVAALAMLGGVWLKDSRLGFLAVCLAGAGVYSAFGVWWSYPTAFLAGAAAAGAVGLINSAGNIGGYVGPFLAGWLRTATGSFQWAFLFFAVSLALAGALMLTLKRR